MPAAATFKIDSGVFSLKLVDRAASGYLDTWQAPGGKTVDVVSVADYTGAGGIAFECQTTKSALTPSSNTNNDTTPATMCSPEITTTIVGVTSYTLDATILQDPHISAGISAYLFEQDTKEAYFYLGLDGGGIPPAAIGRVTISAGAIGGDARTTLTADVSLPLTQKPDMWVGDSTTKRVILGLPPTIKMTSATAGIPGTITPANATTPTDLGGLTSASPAITASPATNWTVGQYVALPGSGTHVNWNGTGWVAGTHP